MCNALLGSKVMKGQPEVKLRNALWLSNLVVRTPDQILRHCWDQRSYRGQPGSTRGQVVRGSI